MNGPFSFRVQQLVVQKGTITWVDAAAAGFFSHFRDAYEWASRHAGDEAFWRVVPFKPYLLPGLEDKAPETTPRPDNVVQMPDPLDEQRGRVILAFREMLSSAEQGEILNYVAIWIRPGDPEQISWRSETTQGVFQLLGALGLFKDHLHRTILSAKGSIE